VSKAESIEIEGYRPPDFGRPLTLMTAKAAVPLDAHSSGRAALGHWPESVSQLRDFRPAGIERPDQ